MKKCSVQRFGVDQYYWLSRCRDGNTECLPMKNETQKQVAHPRFNVGEDESADNANCDGLGITTSVKPVLIPRKF